MYAGDEGTVRPECSRLRGQSHVGFPRVGFLIGGRAAKPETIPGLGTWRGCGGPSEFHAAISHSKFLSRGINQVGEIRTGGDSDLRSGRRFGVFLHGYDSKIAAWPGRTSLGLPATCPPWSTSARCRSGGWLPRPGTCRARRCPGGGLAWTGTEGPSGLGPAVLQLFLHFAACAQRIGCILAVR